MTERIQVAGAKARRLDGRANACRGATAPDALQVGFACPAPSRGCAGPKASDLASR
jgi:hypothetical protein